LVYFKQNAKDLKEQRNISITFMRILNLKSFAPVLAGFALFLTSCSDPEKEAVTPEPTITTEQDPYSDYQVFKIQKGNHYADARVTGEVKTTKLRFQVIFDSTAVYKTIDPNNQFDINKLYGFSDCNTFHQMNSARMGWCWANNQLEIHAYGYHNGIRDSKLIKAIAIGKPAEMSITLTDSTYVFQVEDKIESLPRACTGTSSGYKLFPYFGGDEVAPHDIIVKVKDL
jgi:hypothetical protein